MANYHRDRMAYVSNNWKGKTKIKIKKHIQLKAVRAKMFRVDF